MKKLTKLLALALAVMMLLSTGALAAENSANDGPKLVMYWLDWDEEGHCYANDDVLKAEGGWAEDLHFDPTRGDHVIFFIVDGNKKTPVVPTGDGNINVIKVDKDGIKSGAKQSASYVRLEMKEFKDGVLTAKYSGKELTFPVSAVLPDAGFYSVPEAAVENLLTDGTDPAQLTDLTAYFLVTGSDETDGRHVTDVKKSANGTPSRWELEQVNDTTWKITLKDGQDWIGVNLDVSFLDVEGNAYAEDKGIGFETSHGPELWLQWLSWPDNPADAEPENDDISYQTPVFTPYDELHIALYAAEDDGNKLTPVPVDQLKATGGLTIEPLAPGVKGKEAYANVSGFKWDTDYTISYGEYTMTIKCDLPDIGLYSKPELTTDSYLRDWRFSVTAPNETVYVGSHIPENDDRELDSLKLADFENSDQFTLEKYNDDFYKLTRKTLNLSDANIEFECTWKWPDGNTETWTNGVWTGAYTTALVSEESVWNYEMTRDELPTYASIKDKVSDSLTLNVGEAKTIYLTRTYPGSDSGEWIVWGAAAPMWVTSDSSLKLAAVDETTGEYTISCDKSGTYTLSMQGFWVDKFINEKGEDVTDYVNNAEEMFYWGYDWETGKINVGQGTDKETGKVTNLLEGWSVELQYEPLEWFPITVTVTGEAAKPAFTDVKTNDWFAPAVSYANGKGYMNGNEGKFDPTGKITGAQFAQILYNKEGKPAAAEGAAFQGVTDQWYAPAVLWAAGKGIITDTGDAAVVPTADLTREQIALMLYNYMGKPEAKGELTAFTDAAKVSAWAKDAMAWAVGEGVLKGSDNALNPTGTATRAETAQILMNFFK